MKHFVDGGKAAAFGLSALILLPLALYGAMIQNWPGTALFTLLFFLCAYITFLYGARVRVAREGIFKTFLGIPVKSFSWEEIREVGIIGTHVINKGKKKKTGAMYIYFSPRELDDDQRFRLGLEWPPKGLIYLTFSMEKITEVQMIFSNEIALYNVGDLKL